MKTNENVGRIQNLDFRLKAILFARAKLERSRLDAEEICKTLGFMFTDDNIMEITKMINRIEKRLREELRKLNEEGEA